MANIEIGPIYSEIRGAPQCHCSSIHKLKDGRLIVAFFAGSYEKARDVGIYASFGDASGMHWTEPKIIASTYNRSNGSPVFYQESNGRLHLFYLVMHHGKIIKGGWSVCSIRHKISEDEGRSWYDWEWFRRTWGWVLRNKPIRLKSGRVVIPMHLEVGKMHSFMYINEKEDLSGKWRKSQSIKTPKGNDEPSVVELPDGSLICSLRTHDGKIFLTRSYDGGLHWTSPTPTEFPNPDSQTALYLTSTNKLILVFNNETTGRWSLSYSISDDFGESWHEPILIEEAPERSDAYRAGYSYPSVVELDNGDVLITYTHLRTQIYWANIGKV